MKAEQIYHQWKSYRSQMVVPENFTADVMQRINIAATCCDNESDVFAFEISGRLARWSAAGGLILLGLFRIFFILANLLQPQLLMH